MSNNNLSPAPRSGENDPELQKAPEEHDSCSQEGWAILCDRGGLWKCPADSAAEAADKWFDQDTRQRPSSIDETVSVTGRIIRLEWKDREDAGLSTVRSVRRCAMVVPAACIEPASYGGSPGAGIGPEVNS